jgi:hypothetical protein
MPGGDAPRAYRRDDNPGEQEDQGRPGERAYPVEERNHVEWREERSGDATDVTSSE